MEQYMQFWVLTVLVMKIAVITCQIFVILQIKLVIVSNRYGNITQSVG